MTLPEIRDAKGELIPRDTVIYDVKMRGCDRSFWKTLTGDPSIAANKLRLNAEEAASYFQFLFGTFEFAVNVPAVPTAGDARKIGLINPAAPTRGSIYFEITGTTFRSVSYDDSGTAQTTTLTWSGDGAEQVFKIEWEADYIVFSLAGTAVTSHKTRIGKIPQALYLINSNADNMDTGYLLVKETGKLVG